MKKILIAVVIGLLLVAALATTALADNGPHGNFSSSNTDACAGCHRAHQAQAAGSLLKEDVYGLCTSCHDGTGAYTDVLDGQFAVSHGGTPYSGGTTSGDGDSGAGLFGGGFINAYMSHSWTYKSYYDTGVSPTSQAVTSSHKVNGTAGTIWGSGVFNDGTGTNPKGTPNVALECTSCHDPHGHAGLDSSKNAVATYRLLKFVPDGSNGYEISASAWQTAMTNGLTYAGLGTGTTAAQYGATVTDVSTYWYTVNSDVTADKTLAAFKAGYNSNIYQSVSFGLGAYFASDKGDQYRRPAVPNISSGGSNYSKYSCAWNGASDLRPAGLSNVNLAKSNCPSGLTTGSSFDNYNAHLGVSAFCTQCHDRYFADSNGRSNPSGDPNFMYRHASMTTSIGCLDCHNAHGTTSAASGLVDNTVSYAGGITLLKMDNREILRELPRGIDPYQLYKQLVPM